MNIDLKTVAGSRLTMILAVCLCAAVVVAMTAAPASAGAAWTTGGVPLTTTGDGYAPLSVSDGAGGVISAFLSAGILYAQHVSASGVKLWGPDGIVVRSSSLPFGTAHHAVVSDGQGGAIVGWQDGRSGTDEEIYAQRINSRGVALWTPDGNYVGPAGSISGSAGLAMVADGSQGAWLSWIYFNGASDGMTMNHLDAAGTQLVFGGFVVGNSANIDTPSIDLDGAGGAIVAWYDQSRSDIWANRASAAGAAQWNGIAGIVVCNAPGEQYEAQVVADGNGGAIILWEDYRSTPQVDVFANRLTHSGGRLWGGTAGIRVTSRHNTRWLSAVSDGAGGAVAAYFNGGATTGTVGASHITADGLLSWNGTSGVDVTTTPCSFSNGHLAVSNSNSETFVTWGDLRAGNSVFAQKLDSSGCPVWTPNGDPVVNAEIFVGLDVVPDLAGGCIVAWDDSRAGPGTSIPFAQRMRNDASTWYLAEGSTSWGFSTYITIQNPQSTQVTARVTYMPTGAATVTEDVAIPPASQCTLTNEHLVGVMGGQRDFSTRVQCLQGKSIAVDRTMSWGAAGSGEAHNSVGVTYAASQWFLAEGSSNWGFECWLLIQNPNASAATCQVTYMIEGEAARTVSKPVPANSRASFDMSRDIGAKDASIKVTSNVPVIAERAMYRYERAVGHESVGTTSPASDFYLAEGSTAWGFTTYVLVQNPNDAACDVTVTYMTPEGNVPQPAVSMPANSRMTVRVNDVLPSKDVSTRVHGSRPVIAERAMYWDGVGKAACHDSIGMAQPHQIFYLPDGQTSDGRETWTLVQNPNTAPVTVEIAYMTASGTGNAVREDVIPAGSRKTYNMADAGIAGRAAVKVRSKTAGKKIMCERAMYWDGRGAGTDTIGGYSD